MQPVRGFRRAAGGQLAEEAREARKARTCGLAAAAMTMVCVVAGAWAWAGSNRRVATEALALRLQAAAREYQAQQAHFAATRWELRVGQGVDETLLPLGHAVADEARAYLVDSKKALAETNTTATHFVTATGVLPPAPALGAPPQGGEPVVFRRYNLTLIASPPGGASVELSLGAHAAVQETSPPAPGWKICEYQLHGAWAAGGKCHVYLRLEGICVKVAWRGGDGGQWALDEGGGGHGCSPRAKFSAVSRAAIAPARAQTPPHAPLGAVTVRSAQDPLIAVLNLTHGGYHVLADAEAEREAAGLALLIVGAVLSLPAAILLWPSKSHGRATRYERFDVL